MAQPQTTNVSVGALNLAGNAKIGQVGLQIIHNYDHPGRKVRQELGSTDPFVERMRILHAKGSLLPGSCSWVFKHDSFRHYWDRGGNVHLLWIHGGLGRGKTMISEAIVQELLKRIGKEKNSVKLFAYFFCEFANDRLNSASAILRGLLFSLLEQNEACALFLEKSYLSRETESRSVFWELWSQLTKLVRHLPELEFYFCVDALDECIVHLDLLLDNITFNEPIRNVKWIFTSRNEVYISERLLNAAHSVHSSLELNSQNVTQDIKNFINTEVDGLTAVKALSPTKSSRIKTQLYENAHGMFLWVALVVDVLKRSKNVNVEQQLLACLPGLGPIYQQMLQQVYAQENAEQVESCRRMIRTVVTASQPQTLDGLQVLCGTRNRPKTRSEIKDLIRQCSSFLTIRDDTVIVVHQSAIDFLMSREVNASDWQTVRLDPYEPTLFRRRLQDSTKRGTVYGFKGMLEYASSNDLQQSTKDNDIDSEGSLHEPGYLSVLAEYDETVSLDNVRDLYGNPDNDGILGVWNPWRYRSAVRLDNSGEWVTWRNAKVLWLPFGSTSWF